MLFNINIEEKCVQYISKLNIFAKNTISGIYTMIEQHYHELSDLINTQEMQLGYFNYNLYIKIYKLCVEYCFYHSLL